jgi:DNA helicase HerA-like ATPase
MANRHGLIAGATGTGKTVTLQVLAESFSARGVPVLVADIKGDLAGISQPGQERPEVQQRIRDLGLADFTFAPCPVTLWDVFGAQGHPVRTTISEMGPLLLSRLLQLNDTQEAVLSVVFKAADREGLLLLDLKDLRAMLSAVAQNASAVTTQYGNVSSASLGAIQRGLTVLEQQGADQLLGEPSLNLDDLLQTDPNGRGIINLLAADRLIHFPRLYSGLLLWMLSELFENLPEVGDLPQPKLVFFFDEAHLLFQDTPRSLIEKIEQIVRLIRSKGVGIFFVTQTPQDIPDIILGQLGNRIQHALRAFTPKDQKIVRAAAQTFRTNPNLDTETALTELRVGEALISLLDDQGQPGVVQRALMYPPRSQIGPIDVSQRLALRSQSLVAGVYETPVDRPSAYERLASTHGWTMDASTPSGSGPLLSPSVTPPPITVRRPSDSLVDALAKSAVRTVGSTLGREIVRGLLGSIFGRRRR